MTVAKSKSKSKSLRLSRGHLHSAKCRHSKGKKSRALSRGGAAKKKSRKSRRRRHKSRKSHRRRALSRGGCWLTDMFKGTSKPKSPPQQEQDIIGKALQQAQNTEEGVAKQMAKTTKQIENWNASRPNFSLRKNPNPPLIQQSKRNYTKLPLYAGLPTAQQNTIKKLQANLKKSQNTRERGLLARQTYNKLGNDQREILLRDEHENVLDRWRSGYANSRNQQILQNIVGQSLSNNEFLRNSNK